MIKVGGQFSGVGAFDQALIRLGIDYQNVYQAEWDKYARQTYLHNYEEPIYYVQDVHDTPTKEITDKFGSLDIAMFSPPCQAFSLAGKRLGKADKRGVLFFNSHEFIQVNKPRFFIFENVKGLLSDDNGKTFSEWLNYLGGKSVNGNPVLFPVDEAVPYHIYWKVLNAKDYNVPQNRERVFIVGIREDADNNFCWPKEETLTKRLKDVLEDDVPDKYFLSDETIDRISKWNSNQNPFDKVFDENSIMSCLLARGDGEEHAGMKILKIKSATQKGFELATENDSINFSVPNSKTRRGRFGKEVAQTLDTACNQGICIPVLTPDRAEKRQNGRRFKDDGEEMFTITTQDRHGIFDGFKIRRLTERECFRLMDFPDTFTWPVSASQAYKQAGNSIVVKMLELIISRLNILPPVQP
jgi:DNA (cytosine-5)-methyltransferase 1